MFSAQSLTEFDKALLNKISYDFAKDIRNVSTMYKHQPKVLRQVLKDLLNRYERKERLFLDKYDSNREIKY